MTNIFTEELKDIKTIVKELEELIEEKNDPFYKFITGASK